MKTKQFQPEARHHRLRTRVVKSKKEYCRKDKHKATFSKDLN